MTLHEALKLLTNKKSSYEATRQLANITLVLVQEF